MKIVGIIPARMASSRFPGKPLADICGIPMMGHIYFRSRLAPLLDEVYIATCDQVIADYAQKIGAPCIMTSSSHERASDRTAEAVQKIEARQGKNFDIVAMIQGDEPLVLPEMIEKSIRPLLNQPQENVVSLMTRIATMEDFYSPNVVKVTFDLQQYALYFSREAIPSNKREDVLRSKIPMYKQVGLMAFRKNYLHVFNALPATPLEILESVDMMRVLEHGQKVKMVEIEGVALGVDTPDDLIKAINAMRIDTLKSHYDMLTTA